ncbi:MAG: hypothetical protein NTV66_01505 [Methylococcales bacterium]|nr:hypothetical protein [Methylococcales bacterium]
MMDSKIKGLAFCSLVALFATGQAFAHTGVRDKAIAGLASYNGFTITHSCGGGADGVSYPVIGQSALFPFGALTVWKTSTGAVLGRGVDGHAGIDTIMKDHTGAALPDVGINLQVTGYDGGSPFASTFEIFDDKENVQGLLWKDGAMPNNMNAITPFKVTAPKIPDNCISALNVRIGVINYCDVGKNAANDNSGPYKAPKDEFGRRVQNGTAPNSPVFKTIAGGNGDNNRSDWWFTALDGDSTLYNDIDLLQPSYWSTMTVTNPTAHVKDSAGALACPGGATRTISVEPTGAAFDAYLNEANTRGFSKGSSGF